MNGDIFSSKCLDTATAIYLSLMSSGVVVPSTTSHIYDISMYIRPYAYSAVMEKKEENVAWNVELNRATASNRHITWHDVYLKWQEAFYSIKTRFLSCSNRRLWQPFSISLVSFTWIIRPNIMSRFKTSWSVWNRRWIESKEGRECYWWIRWWKLRSSEDSTDRWQALLSSISCVCSRSGSLRFYLYRRRRRRRSLQYVEADIRINSVENDKDELGVGRDD